ncbi:hypothetical protein [Hoeflea prorocentri]|uniref:Isoquinoline 1-oxidoreductase subunit n=1 Tax=Hoeflea prorocentri TaxID=1922333 RepID=A0A9X3UMS2_9HYPH|nr:hypothetical protein [Hoeflea prorocentri]MCY6383255.1 hypothetical protein [Hoeflea prorocentri]MDA5401055.1 hypothetical protein [Hoeflea prorocentri]
MKTSALAAIWLAAFGSVALAAEPVGTDRVLNEFAEGSVSFEEGLANWQLFYDVASHPRCSNCHVGADNRPMWSGPSYGRTRPHGMNINAGESRIGAETLLCSTCHTDVEGMASASNDRPHAAPRVSMTWQLAPVEAEWFGKSSAYVCEQLKDPERNGNRTIKEVAAHLDHDLILHWAWEPGGNREPAPHSLQATMDALMKWAAAGTPCPTE